ncbi:MULTISPECIES: prepilin-type N-terminal cleavage/methylation domain-containing protein [Sporosarcina]|uniref:prepilin-type N-terminal cleavage/methylation domain-containing protein n=1 Tax=Sporosarcina TaxID=1569 RepID=UPI0005914567
MLKTHKDESGVTLVELLAVLVLISLVTGIIWTAINISVRHSAVETTKLQLQQDANLIITRLQQEHRTRTCYRLTVESSEVSISNCEGQDSFKLVLGNSYRYSSSAVKSEYVPKKNNVDNFTLTVQDPENRNLAVDVTTSITRYKTE